jgi:hypothetical protein
VILNEGGLKSQGDSKQVAVCVAGSPLLEPPLYLEHFQGDVAF